MMRVVRFVSPSGLRVSIPVRAVDRLSRFSRHLEVTAEQDAAIQTLEARHKGLVPITEEEAQALTSGDLNLLHQLAQSPDSNLRLFFGWQTESEG